MYPSKEICAQLNDQELEALRASLPWYDPENRRFSFPRGEAEKVASSLAVTPDTLRQRRCRSMKRLKKLKAEVLANS